MKPRGVRRAPAAEPTADLAGFGAILAAAVLWSTIGVVSVHLFELGLSPADLAFWRAAVAAAGLSVWALLRRPDLYRIERRSDLLWLFLYGAVAVALFYPALLIAVERTSVAVAIVLLYTSPVFVAIGSRVLLGERITPGKGLALGMVVAGVWTTALGAAGADVRLDPAGVAWGIAAALAYASYYLFGRGFVPRLGAPRVLLWSLLFGTPLLLAALVAAGTPPTLTLPSGSWIPILALGLGATLAANLSYYWGIRRIEAGRAAVVASVEPVLAALLAFFLFDQALLPLGWIGIGLVAAGVAAAPFLGGRDEVALTGATGNSRQSSESAPPP